MSSSAAVILLRDACVKAIDEAQSKSLEDACAMMPGMAKTTDEYAMAQVDRLAFARAMTFCRRIINDETKKLTQPEDKQDVKPTTKTGAMY